MRHYRALFDELVDADVTETVGANPSRDARVREGQVS
jgi:hypothetical protein